MITFDRHWHAGEVCSSQINPGFNCTGQMYRSDGRQLIWCCVGKRFANVKVVNRVPQGGSGVMVWAGIC
jgi:hypothetical protein